MTGTLPGVEWSRRDLARVSAWLAAKLVAVTCQRDGAIAERDHARAVAVELEQRYAELEDVMHRVVAERDEAVAAADLALLERDLAAAGYVEVVEREGHRK